MMILFEGHSAVQRSPSPHIGPFRNFQYDPTMRRFGGTGGAAIFTLGVLSACGSTAPNPKTASPASHNAPELPCAASPARKLLAQGRLLAARRQIQDAESPRTLGCVTEKELSQFEAEVTRALGKCGPKGAGTLCTSNENLSPPEAVTRARALLSSGQDAEAHRVLDRARYAAEMRKEKIEVVPAWLTKVEHITFVEPDRFVISHEGGTSVVEGDELRERTRCPQETHPSLLSPLRHFGYLWKQKELLELSTCKTHSLGQVLAYSASEDLVLARQGEHLRVWDRKSDAIIWEKEFPVGETQKEVKGGCFSPENSQVVVALGFGGVQVHELKQGSLVWEAEVPPKIEIKNHLQESIDPIDRTCDFSKDGSLLTISGSSNALVGLYESTLGFEPTSGQLLFHKTPYDSSQTLASPSAQGNNEPEDDGSIVMDENRYMISPPGSDTKTVLFLTKERVAHVRAGRFLEYGNSLLHLPSQRRLPTHPTASAETPLVWHQDALCTQHRCFFEENQFLYRRGADNSEATGVEDFYGHIHVARGLHIDSTEVTHEVSGVSHPWQWPQDVLADVDRGDPEVAKAFFSESGDTAWLLTPKGKLLAFSTTSGRLVARVVLESSDGCQRDVRRGGVAAMAGSARAGVLLIRPPGGAPCSYLVDTQSHTAKPTPLPLSGEFQVSEDGRRAAVRDGRELVVYSLKSFEEIARIPSRGDQFSFSHSGDKIVQLAPGYYEKGPGGFMRDMPAAIRWRNLRDEDLTTPLRFPDDTLDSTDPKLEASPRLVAFENRLYDYSGRQVAEVFTHGRGALISYATGEAEVFGSGPDSLTRCLVGGRVVPELFCASLRVEGKLRQLLGGLPKNEVKDARGADKPLPAHCFELVTPCGNELSLDARSLHCSKKAHFDPEQARCLRHVRNMKFSGDSFSGLAPEQPVRELQWLTIESKSFSDLSPFRGARRLLSLVAKGTSVNDLSPLEDLEQLRELDLSNTAVTDLSPLQGLTQLEELDLSGTQVSDLAPLEALVNLRELRLNNTKVRDLSPLLSLPRLKELDISDTQVERVPSLVALVALDELRLQNVRLENWSFVEASPNLRSLGITPSLLTTEQLRTVRTHFPRTGIRAETWELVVR